MKDKKDQYRYIASGQQFTICAVVPGTSKFNIGDVVRIISKGEIYSSYAEMVKAMFLDYNKWIVSKKCKITDLEGWTIAGIRYHDADDAIICGIVKDNRVYLIGENGLELQCSKFLTDDLFEI